MAGAWEGESYKVIMLESYKSGGSERDKREGYWEIGSWELGFSGDKKMVGE
jgi:hypothetical protein